MNENLIVENDHAREEVAELLERRTRVQQWLQRLQEQRGTVSDRVLDRVRSDYEQRLRQTLEALSSHRESLRAQLDSATTRLVEAEDRHAQAEDALEEGRLRNTIGELDQEAWSAERVGLESTVETAAARETAAREETERLRDLLTQLSDGARPIAATPTNSNRAPAPAPMEVEEDSEAETFIEEIDRAISDTVEEAEVDLDQELDDDDDEVEVGMSGPEEPTEDTAPKPGLKCPECGYTNDISAWFCGVCGADIG
jgi:chromosome segregation ATPase